MVTVLDDLELTSLVATIAGRLASTMTPGIGESSALLHRMILLGGTYLCTDS